MLQGKYLKYTEDITFEIFEKIVKKLEEAGLKPFADKDNKKMFIEFQKTGYLLESSKKNYFNLYTNDCIGLQTQIQVSDIIGPQFEVGKWYKYSADYITNFTCAKYSTNQSVSGRFYYDEIITDSNGYKKGHNWSVLTCNPVLLTDLSEIQQYLPENHPDKISKSLTVDDLVGEEDYKIGVSQHITHFEGSINDYSVKTTLRHATPEEIAKVTKLTFEFNKWYKYPNKKTLIFIKENLKDCYGFTAQDWWKNNWNISDVSLSDYIPATPEEVKERLLSYAKEKYPIGTKIIDVNHKKEVTVYSDYFDYYEDTQHVTYGESVYLKGQWAEIISKPIKTGKGILEATEVNRNVYYEVSNQEQYNEILDWLESKGEILHKTSRNFDVIGNWKYVVFNLSLLGSWALNDNIPNLPKAEFKFKSKESHSDQVIDIMNSESKQSHRKIPTVEKVTNRFKASPVRKRNLPEIF